MTSHPKDLSDDLILAMKECDKVCKHMHLPLQSGSSRILKIMNRHYDKEQYLTIVKKLREAIPDIALTTDIIVGFPGETEEDFQETLEVVNRWNMTVRLRLYIPSGPAHRPQPWKISVIRPK